MRNIREIQGLIIYNVDIIYNNNSVHSNFKCNYECMLFYDSIYIKVINIKDSNYNDMINKCKNIINDYIKFNNIHDDYFINYYNHNLGYNTQVKNSNYTI